jgi:aminocarboxymuconate-semialdehyde decarboxylase
MRIDVHNHVIPERALALLRSQPAYGVTVDDGVWRGAYHAEFPLSPSFVDPDAKLAELGHNAIDAAVLSAAPPLFFYDRDATDGAAMCTAVNDGLAEFRESAPDRLWWLAHVPMQDPERAAEMLDEQAGKSGCVGAHIGSAVGGARLDSDRFEPFWAAAERLGTPVMIHPHPTPASDSGLDAFYLINVVGMPLETTVTIKRLIGAGVLERHPGLRIVLLHGGGYFPYQAGRMRHARTVRPELAGAPADPWAALGQLWFDVITHDQHALRYLAERVGLERVVLGTDLPFDMALPDPVRKVEAALGEAGLHAVAERNPASLFGLDESDMAAEANAFTRRESNV